MYFQNSCHDYPSHPKMTKHPRPSEHIKALMTSTQQNDHPRTGLLGDGVPSTRAPWIPAKGKNTSSRPQLLMAARKHELQVAAMGGATVRGCELCCASSPRSMATAIQRSSSRGLGNGAAVSSGRRRVWKKG